MLRRDEAVEPRSPNGFAEHDSAALGDFNIQEAIDMVRGLLMALRAFLSATSLITLAVGGVGVMNIMLAMVSERTREIGLRKAIGASNRAIFAEILAETVLITVESGAVGIAIGWLGVTAAAARIGEQTMQSAPVLHAGRVAVVFAILVATGVASAILPALRAMRVDPAAALRVTG